MRFAARFWCNAHRLVLGVSVVAVLSIATFAQQPSVPQQRTTFQHYPNTGMTG